MKRIYIILFFLLFSVLTRAQTGVERIEDFTHEKTFLNWTQQTISIPFVASDLSECTPEAMQEMLEIYFMLFYPDVVSSVQVNFMQGGGEWLLSLNENTTNNTRVISIFAVDSLVVQSAKNQLLAFKLAGDGIIPSGGCADLMLDYSQKDVTYKVLKDGSLYKIVMGTGYPLQITGITEPGMYTVRAEYGGVSLMMLGSIVVNYPLEQAGTDRIEDFPQEKIFLHWNQQIVRIPFLASDLSGVMPEAMQYFLEMLFSAVFPNMVSGIQVNFLQGGGEWILSLNENTTTDMRKISLAGFDSLVVQSAKNQLLAFKLSGDRAISSERRANLMLEYSQRDVIYKILKDGSLYKTVIGTGFPLQITDITATGEYTVMAEYGGVSLMMLGSVIVNDFNSFCPSPQYNSTTIYTYLDPTTAMEDSRSIIDITYFDGLEREIQKIAVGASPNGSDIVQPIYQRSFGKNKITYLPFVKQSNLGSYVDQDTLSSNWNTAYGTVEAAYARGVVLYDNSPLDRVIKQIGAGKNWHDNDRAIRFDYSTNVSNEVLSWMVSTAGTLANTGFYPAGSLVKNVVIDEDGNKQEEFKDRFGSVILSVTYEKNVAHKTHYAYDNKGFLRLVIPPAVGDKSSLTSDEVKKWCFSYSYDNQGRLIEKRLPGIEPEYSVYDAKNRIVLHQTGNQRLSNTWSYNLYDGHNRIYESGECMITTALTSLRVTIGNALNYIPANRTPLVYNYFDNYSFSGVQAFVPSKNISEYVDADGIDNGYFDYVSGQKTGSKIKVLDNTGTNWITQTIYYDCYQRVIQEIKTLYPSGSSLVSSRYDFTGNIVERKEWQTVNSTESLIDRKYTYDDRGRLKSNKLKVNSDPEITLAELGYDGLGRLLSKKYHNGIETQIYDYNVRDWLTGITGNKFKEELRYETVLSDLDTSRYFNGNISFMSWQNGTEARQAYAYRYDGLGRLKKATYCNLSATNVISNKGKNDVPTINYDKNGNILVLQRKKNGTIVDNLTYGYNGNLLQNVLDASTTQGGYPTTTGALTDQKYSYDANGNLTKDLNNKITNVSYNFINLPRQVTKNGQVISYIYSATGEKLQTSFGSSNVLNYNHSLIREGSSLKYITTEEGRYVMNGASGMAEYHLKDHLGNVRVVLNSAGVLVQSNSYYPFGSLLSQGGGSDNRYLFNGKEQQEITSWTDYGWRMYDGVIGRWGGVDKLSEKMYSVSCFAYGLNNPVKYQDLFGLLPSDPIMRHYVLLDDIVVTAKRTYINPFAFYYSMSTSRHNIEDQIQRWKQEGQKIDAAISSLKSTINKYDWKKGIHTTMTFSDYLGTLSSSIAGWKYSSDYQIGNFYLRSGYWRTPVGIYRPLSLLEKGINGKHIRGYGGYLKSYNMAVNSVKFVSDWGRRLGWINFVYSGYRFFDNQTILNGADLVVAGISIVYWEVGLVYLGTKTFVNGMQNYYMTMIENGLTPGVDDQIIWK